MPRRLPQAQIPFELCVRNDNALWGASGSEVIHLAYTDNVWASSEESTAPTPISPSASHSRPRFLDDAGDLDPTYIETNIPGSFAVSPMTASRTISSWTTYSAR